MHIESPSDFVQCQSERKKNKLLEIEGAHHAFQCPIADTPIKLEAFSYIVMDRALQIIQLKAPFHRPYGLRQSPFSPACNEAM